MLKINNLTYNACAYNVYMRKVDKMEKTLTDRDKIKLIAEYKKGVSVSKLAKKYNRSRSAIYQFIRRRGIKTNRKELEN